MSKINKLLDVWKKLGFRVGTRQVGYKVVEYLSLKINYDKWIKNNEPTAEELEKQRAHKFKKQPKISIVIPMYKTDEGFFKELIDCFKAQTYENWELCLADGSPSENPEFAIICAGDKRIVYKYLGRPGGISDNTNEGLKMVTGDFVAFMDHDDLIPVFSLYEIVKAFNEHEKVDYIYTDEDKIMDGRRFNPHFKPDYSPELMSAAEKLDEVLEKMRSENSQRSRRNNNNDNARRRAQRAARQKKQLEDYQKRTESRTDGKGHRA